MQRYPRRNLMATPDVLTWPPWVRRTQRASMRHVLVPRLESYAETHETGITGTTNHPNRCPPGRAAWGRRLTSQTVPRQNVRGQMATRAHRLTGTRPAHRDPCVRSDSAPARRHQELTCRG